LSLGGLETRKVSPYASPFLMLDRVESYLPAKRRLTGVKCLSQNEPLMQGHFPGYPIFPGVLLIECLAQASSYLMNLDELAEVAQVSNDAVGTLAEAKTKNLLVESRIKHISPVFPGDRITLETEILVREGKRCSFRVRALVNGAEVTKGQIALEPAAHS
jgi:3-hydroxyacyl-[acyl-carrier-protein] dehydratase